MNLTNLIANLTKVAEEVEDPDLVRVVFEIREDIPRLVVGEIYLSGENRCEMEVVLT